MKTKAPKRTGKVEMRLSERQIRELVAWADDTPGWREMPVLKGKLKALKITAANDAVMKFIEDRIAPGLERFTVIEAAAKFSKQIGKALEAGTTDDVTRAANLLQQQAAFDWALKHKQAGTFDLDDPEFLETFVEVSKATRSGLVAVDRKAITDARVATLEARLRESEEAKAAAVAAVDGLSGPGAAGLTVAARNKYRMEAGLPLLEEEEEAA